VFILIAGTYTPIALLALDGGPHWGLLATVWGLALFGIGFCITCRERFEWFRVTLCVAMGWLAVAWMGPLVDGVGWEGSGLLLAGGVAYTAGIVFYAWESLPYNHAIWHMFVLGGSAAHFVAIMLFVI
jgi:hemolysin III